MRKWPDEDRILVYAEHWQEDRSQEYGAIDCRAVNRGKREGDTIDQRVVCSVRRKIGLRRSRRSGQET